MVADSPRSHGEQAERLPAPGRDSSGSGREPEEVADIALFLTSDLASYVNGEGIPADGGFTHT